MIDPTLQAALAAAGSFCVVSLILVTIILICKGHKNRSSVTHGGARTRGLRKPKTKPGSELTSMSFCESATFDPSIHSISMQELVFVTRNFSPDLIIGDGSFGLVYKARLKSGQVVAVKKLSADAFQGLREFRAEMETLGKTRTIGHPNIVKMLGYCSTGLERVLIYEFIEKGSLDQWLYDTSSVDDYENEEELRLPLSWSTRMKIVKGVAKGLAYMHNLETPIIHRDIKASNVLLGADFEAHIADFGLARRMEGSHSHVSTQVAGTMGYMPPEYIHGATMATMTGDVYSFGVLLLEIVAGRRPSFPFPGEDGKEIRLMEWINKMAGENRFMEMVDCAILKDELKETMVVDIFKIGIKCADEKWKLRPTMREVVEELDKILT